MKAKEKESRRKRKIVAGRRPASHKQTETKRPLQEETKLAAMTTALGAALVESGTLRRMLQRCAELMVRHLDVPLVRIWTLNQEEQVLEMQASAGMYTHIDGGHSRVPVGKFKIGLIAQERKPHLTNSVIGDPRVHDQAWARREGLVSFAGYPMLVDDRLVGVIAMFARKRLPEAVLDTVGAVALVMGQSIERKRADEKMQRQRERQTILSDINIATTSTLNLREVLDILLEKIDFYLPYSGSSIALLNRESGELEPFACRNLNAELWKQGLRASRLLAGRGLTKIVFQNKAPLVVQNIQTDPRVANPQLYRMQGLASYVGVPLIAKGEAVGVLSVNTKEEHEFNSEESEFLSTIAGQAATAIHNSLLHQQVRERSVELANANMRLLTVKEELEKDIARRMRAEEEVRLRRQWESALHEVNLAMTSTLSLRATLEILSEKIHSLLPYTCGIVRLLNKESGILQPMGSWNLGEEEWQGLGWMQGGLSAAAFDSKRPLMVKNILADPRAKHKDFAMKHGLVSYLGLPLIAGDKGLGVLAIQTKKEHDFSNGELDFLTTLAGQAAMAIQNSRLYEDVRSNSERLDLLSRQMLELQESERRHLARELHDEIGQALTALKINLQANLQTVRDLPLGPVQSRITENIRIVDQLLQQVRNLALDLRPAILDDLGLIPALRWYLDHRARQAGLEPQLTADADIRAAPSIETACFRIAQEALTNVIRHARANRVWVELLQLEGRLRVTIRDDGAGFDVQAVRDRLAQGKGLGLLGMEERALLAGGQIEINSEPAKGTKIRVSFPLASKTPSSGPGT